MASVDELYEAAMKLSEAERQELSDRLFQSTLPEAPGEPISREDWERVWAEEIERRSDEFHAGTVKGIDAFEAIEQLQRFQRSDHRFSGASRYDGKWNSSVLGINMLQHLSTQALVVYQL